MPSFRLRTTPSLSRTFSSGPHLSNPPFEIIPRCPPSTCACAPMPTLNIDYTRPLANTIPPYTQHIVVPTGQHDWPSRIENSDRTTTWGRLTSYLKHELGPKGGAFDPNNPVLITSCSFSPSLSSSPKTAPTSSHLPASQSGSLLLFPSFQHYQHLSLSPTALRTLLPAIRSSHTHLPTALSKIRSTHGGPAPIPLLWARIRTPTILICSHNSRDTRCGTLGPILQAEFTAKLSHFGLRANTGAFSHQGPDTVNVGCISHVGGHAWAGNVIIYTPTNTENALSGTGVWYGRVEPWHIDGIVRETVLGGRIIGELWRGGIGRDGGMMRV